jgi:hypothetical protein
MTVREAYLPAVFRKVLRSFFGCELALVLLLKAVLLMALWWVCVVPVRVTVDTQAAQAHWLGALARTESGYPTKEESNDRSAGR